MLLTATLPLMVLFWGAPTAQAEEGGDYEDIEEDVLTAEQLRALHRKFDGDQNGKVSLQEVMHFSTIMSKAIASRDIQAILEEIDSSKDGKISLEEHLADIHNQADGGDEEEMKELEERKKLEAAKHGAADMNKDGVLDRHELPALFYPETHEDVLSIVVADTLRQKDKNGDGKVSDREFWGIDEAEGDEAELSEEERQDFALLDKDGDGFINEREHRDWESGKFHITEAFKKLFEIADKDNDMHVTADELAAARDEIGTSDAQYHLLEWAEHHEL